MSNFAMAKPGERHHELKRQDGSPKHGADQKDRGHRTFPQVLGFPSHVPRRKMPVEPNGFAAKPSIVKWFLSGHHGAQNADCQTSDRGVGTASDGTTAVMAAPELGAERTLGTASSPARAATQVVIGPSHRRTGGAGDGSPTATSPREGGPPDGGPSRAALLLGRDWLRGAAEGTWHGNVVDAAHPVGCQLDALFQRIGISMSQIATDFDVSTTLSGAGR